MTRRHLPFAIFASLCIVLLWPALWSGQIPAFRDTMHFYYPLWSFIERGDTWSQIVPMWNRYDVFGSSMIGEATTMAFYPPRFVLLLDVFSLGQRIGLFLLLHLLLANVATYRFARYLRLPRISAHVAAASYSLCGPVCFQVYNPVFLVGAAWLPFALHMGWKIFRDGSPRAMLGLSAALAMMVLGGDAQCAYHMVLIGVILVSIQLVQSGLTLLRSRIGRQRPITKAWYQSIFRGHAVLAVILSFGAVAFAIGLSAIQILPTLDWVSSSNRLAQGTNFDSQRFQFSVSLSDWMTAVVPNFKGTLVPFHTRWYAGFAPQDRVWVPSLHFGTIGIALFILHLFVSGDRSTRRLRIVFTIAVLSSLGMHGLGSVLNTVGNWLGNTHPSGQVASEIGGLQWLWTKVLPFYSEFRYPAKWLPFAILPACLLAAKSLLSPEARMLNLRILFALICLAGVGTTIFAFFLPQFDFTKSIPSEPLFGEFSVGHARLLLVVSGVQAILVGALAPTLINRLRRTADSFNVPWSGIALCLLLSADLGIASNASLGFVSPHCLRADAKKLDPVRKLPLELPAPTGMPTSEWLCKVAQAQTQNEIGKLHLLEPHQSFHAQFSFEPAAVERFKQLNSQQEWLEGNLTEGVDLTWISPSVCRIANPPAAGGTVVVPIFADHGWQAFSVDASGKRNRVPIKSHAALFVSVDSPANSSFIQLEYRPRGLTLGAIVSLLACVAWSVSFLLTAKRAT